MVSFAPRSACCSICAVLKIGFVSCDTCNTDLHAQEMVAPMEHLYEQCSALLALYVCD
jgi:hypothetical protein